ncbi:hypothetical protein KSS87_011327 [Heliosperma pusillum]|nr:hypothetical protein KSS87_002739 [Heliosperma pusillum]KAH9625304.1 hypothetical protein KSS87_011322 [Heliosperma pusillum]KAH9625309.1 hypothetical protein KSS87_011327 [Heliosperma pusillum]
MGRGGRGGGGGGGRMKLPRFMRGFTNRIFGPPRGMADAFDQLAIARGLRDADELLGRLGKQVDELSFKESLDLLRKECSPEEFEDIERTWFYRPGKGYGPCNDLLKKYLKGIKESDGPGFTAYRLKQLKKYCGYTDAELNSLM